MSQHSPRPRSPGEGAWGCEHSLTAPEVGTIEAWCLDYISAEEVAAKCSPGEPPALFDGYYAPDLAVCSAMAPGRGVGLRVQERAERIPRPAALREASARAKLLHVFMHHEIQAAELSAWAILRFPDAPAEFRRGLLGILDDEARHAQMYLGRVRELGSQYGDFAVRDWFWEKARHCTTPLQYTALMGLGFEGANIDHAARFERQLRDVNDERSADLVGQVGREEVSHVRFASRWFAEWTGEAEGDGPDYDRWCEALPPPLTPAVFKGDPVQVERRARAGLSRSFLGRLMSEGKVRGTTQKSPRRAGIDGSGNDSDSELCRE